MTLIVAALTLVRCSDQFAPNPPPPNAAFADVQAPIIFVGAGDISSCTRDGDTKTALLVESILNANPTAWAFLAGDNVYEDGSTAEYEDCYGPTWGRFKDRTRPSLGNHEYDGVEGSKPSFDYFGDALWENSRPHGYYSFNLGESWHIVMLNSNPDFIETAVGSAQDTWLKADLAANHRPCIAAIFHHPRFWSSTDPTSSKTRSSIRPFWLALYAAGADLILNGHSHNYERFAPQNPDAVLDPERGIRQFIVGMGGKSVSPATNIHVNSEVRNGNTFGVLELTLNASSYSWRFVPEAGKTFEDTGTNNCHGSPGGVQTNTPPTASFSHTCSGLNCTFNSDASTDVDGTITTRLWEFGDGTTSAEANPPHAYATANTYTVNLTVTDDDGAPGSTTQPVQAGTSPPVSGGAVFVGAGDIAHCSLASDEATAKLLDALPSATVFTLGDNASSVGSATDYTNCYGPTWGRHKARTRPAVGYMDYKTSNASGYFGYFGAAAGNPAEGYYSYNLGDWHIIALNSKVPMGVGSAQEQWLRADLTANPKVCTMAYIARARFSSGKNGNDTKVQPLWQALYERGADIMLAGSDHTYERFARQTPAGAADPTNGIQQFVVGTGGQSLTSLVTPQPNSVVFNGSTFGVLKLTLGSRGYTWEFVPVAGSTFTDAGSMDCVGAPPQAPNVAPTASFSEVCTGLSCAFTDASTDNDGTIKTRSWEFGDGATSTAANPTHLYAAEGTYTVTLTVTDDDDALSNPAATHPVPVSNQRPTAGFVATCTDLDCDFENASEDADGTIGHWEWNFGDGTIVEGNFPAPSHHYLAADTYTVTLTVKDDHDAESEAFTGQATVSEPVPNVPPTADFDPPSCTAGVACAFDDTSTDDGTIATRRWNFGDGTAVLETADDPVSHTYATAGLYQVTLTVIDDDGEASAPLVEEVTAAEPPPNPPPVASFTAPACTTGVACSFDDTSTDDGTIATRRWNFGDGTAVLETADDPVSHTYATADLYQVTLTVIDDDLAESNPVVHNVTVADPPANPPPVAAFIAPACTTGVACSFDDTSTDDGTIATRRWNFGDGTAVLETADDPVSHTYTTAGGYTVILTVVDNGGATSDPVAEEIVTVSDPPNGAPTAAFSRVCNNLACTFTDQSTDPDAGGTIKTRSWTFGDGSSSTSQNPQHTYAAGGSKTVTLSVTDNADQPSATPATQTFTVAANVAPTAAFTAPACTAGVACSFTHTSSDGDGTIVSRSWNFGDGGTSSSNSPSRTYTAAGTYTVRLTVTDDDGATGTTTRSVTVTAPATNGIPTALFGSACTKLSCKFTDRSIDPDGNGTIVAWSWNFGDGTTSTARHPTRVYRARGSYKVKLTVTDNRGATDPITHTVTVRP